MPSPLLRRSTTTTASLIVDTSGVFNAQGVHDTLRTWSASAAHRGVHSRAHRPRVRCLSYEEEARTNGGGCHARDAHAAIVARFERYRMTAGSKARSSTKDKFKHPDSVAPRQPARRDDTDSLSITVGRRGDSISSKTAARPTTHVGVGSASRVWFARATCLWASPNVATREGAALRATTGRLRAARCLSARTEVAHPGPAAESSAQSVAASAGPTAAELLEHSSRRARVMNEGARSTTSCRGGGMVRQRGPLARATVSQPRVYGRPVRGGNLWSLYGVYDAGDPAI